MNLSELISINLLNTDKNSTHSYIDYFYESVFSNYKSTPIVLVELGVQYGGSIKLWDLYFDNCEIYALDMEVQSRAFEKFCENQNNIHYIIGDACSNEIADKIPKFDIFIDDGSHSLKDQMTAIKLYLPRLKDSGVFIIEDVQDYNELTILKNYTQSLYSGYTFEFIDLRIVKYRYDDLMLVIKKRNMNVNSIS